MFQSLVWQSLLQQTFSSEQPLERPAKLLTQLGRSVQLVALRPPWAGLLRLSKRVSWTLESQQTISFSTLSLVCLAMEP